MNSSPLLTTTNTVLYEQVADRIQGLILEGTLRPGDRLPSVRKLREQLSVSISTVLEAYRVLEDRGLICARPQSGYYVKSTALMMVPEPTQSNPPHQVSDIDMSLAFRVIRSARQLDLIQLGAAIPGMAFLPTHSLNRLMGQTLRNHPLATHSYDAPPGCEPLRHEIAKRMLDAGCLIAPEQVMITNGATEALYLSLQTMTQPGDTVAIESPTYYAMLEMMKALKLKALELPTHPRDGLSLDALEKALQHQHVKGCMVVSNFSNPLGSCMSDAKKKAFVELLNRYEAWLIEDDIYGDIYFEGHRPKAIKAFDTENRVLYCSSFSKTLSPGLRVGWVVAGRYQSKVEQLKLVVTQTSAIAPQLAIAAFLANGGYDRHLRTLRRAYQTQMGQMLQAIYDAFPTETRVTRPTGGHILWLEMPEGFDALALYEEALQHRISIAPGVMFSPTGGYRHCFRLNTALPWSEDIEQALKTLGYLAKKQMAMLLLSKPAS
jgi:DNA-binding transcriptional MocR family regulator